MWILLLHLTPIILISALASPYAVAAQENQLRGEVHAARADSYAVEDGELAAFKVRFGVRITNQTQHRIALPPAERAPTSDATLSVVGVMAKRADGTWSRIVASSWYDVGNVRYRACEQLPPKGTRAIGKTNENLVIPKKQLPGLGESPTIRLHLLLYCRQPGGQITFENVTTDPFTLSLPGVP